MAKNKQDKPESILEEITEVVVPTEPKREVKKVLPTVAKEEPVREPVVSFDRWFRSRSSERGYQTHWISGMRAFIKTSGKKTMSDWDKVFINY